MRKWKSSLSLMMSFTLLVVGCAQRPVQETSPTTEVIAPQAASADLREVESFKLSDADGPKVVDEELEQIPVEINPLVEKWVDYFQGKGRPHMERYLSRSTRYMKLMKKILRDNGLPEDLVYIALIESGFSPKATSRAAAVGYWQFIKATGRRYGMEINTFVDDRRDPVLATQAAAEYFKGLYSVFGSWYLAMASYNVGENRVKKEVMRTMTRDFWELAKKKRFPRETINYIPKFIAAKLIGNNPEKYGFVDLDYMTPIEFEHIKVDKPVNLKAMAEKMGMDYDDLKQLNPKFKGEIAPTKQNGSLELRVPLGSSANALVAARAAAVEKVEYIADAGETELYKVKSGDSLYTIARKYRTTVAWLRDQNDMKKGRKLRIGQRVIVPDRAGRKQDAKYIAKKEKTEKENDSVEKAAPTPEIVTNKGVFYVVQPGDTLSAIADDYNSSIEELRKMNKMSKGTILRAGMRLKVPKDDGLPVDPNGSKSDEKLAKGAESDSENETEKTASRAPQQVVALNSVEQRNPQSTEDGHIVRAGENLSSIAKKYGVTIHAIRKANNLKKRSVLKVGSRLVIPTDARPQTNRAKTGKNHKFASLKTVKAPVVARRKLSKFHVVKKGENLTQIADKYNVEIGDIRKKNSKIKGSKLFVGSKLLIPTANAKE